MEYLNLLRSQVVGVAIDAQVSNRDHRTQIVLITLLLQLLHVKNLLYLLLLDLLIHQKLAPERRKS